MNKRGSVESFVLAMMYTVIYILASPIISDVIAGIVPNLDPVAGFFAKILLWFGLLMLLMGLLKKVGSSNNGVFS